MSEIAAHAPEIAGDPDWHTTADVAKRFRTAPGTVRYWRHIGYGPKSVKVGRRVLYTAAEIERFEAALLASAA
ncbi:helix-turn-helix transcriptional regulator [Streptomyces lavendulae]|uniref:helix-turn-helix transcriptional regulator n=1 Tax=Streptomyces lavendulae TaxID=1914 RepID=UPI0033D009C7